jgi:hypothetical protein
MLSRSSDNDGLQAGRKERSSGGIISYSTCTRKQPLRRYGSTSGGTSLTATNLCFAGFFFPLLQPVLGVGGKGNGKTTDALAEFVDIYPTLCELAGLPLPKSLEGDSLVPLLNNPAGSVKSLAISQFPRKHGGVDYMGYTMRTARYRYVEWIVLRTGKTAFVEIYDHQNDPEENENIAVQPGREQLAKQLARTLWKKIPRPKAANSKKHGTSTISPKPVSLQAINDQQFRGRLDEPGMDFIEVDEVVGSGL